MSFVLFSNMFNYYYFNSAGNHESSTMNQMYGFEGEVKAKYPLTGKSDKELFLFVFMMLVRSFRGC